MSDSWYYTSAGQQSGPVSKDDLRGLMASGHVSGQDLAWKDGMAQWTPISLLPELLGAGGQAAGEGAYSAPGQPGVAQLNYGGYQQYSAAAPGYPQQFVYGGFWIRVGAYIIDYLILLVPGMIINASLQFALGLNRQAGPPDPAQLASIGMISLIPLVLNWLYYALMESSSKQATVGKMACGLMVIDERGQRISFGRATGRYFAKILSFMVCFIGVIMVGVDERKRGWHDQLAKTFVVTKGSLMGATWGA